MACTCAYDESDDEVGFMVEGLGFWTDAEAVRVCDESDSRIEEFDRFGPASVVKANST